MFCPSTTKHQSKPCFISSSLIVTKSVVSNHSLYPSYSLWPEKDDINPKVNVPGRGAEEWVGVWVTHLGGFYASIAVKLNSPFFLISLTHLSLVHLSFCYFPYFYCRPTSPLKSCPAVPYTSALLKQPQPQPQLLAASRLTLVYLISSCRAHVHSHQESFNVTWCIAMAINSTVTGAAMGVKTGDNVWTLPL